MLSEQSVPEGEDLHQDLLKKGVSFREVCYDLAAENMFLYHMGEEVKKLAQENAMLAAEMKYLREFKISLDDMLHD